MMASVFAVWMSGLGLVGCATVSGTAPPPEGWANNAPTVVEQVVQRDELQLLSVRQGELQTWVIVPNVHAAVGDYVLLGAGVAQRDVHIPEIDQQVPMLVDIEHIQVVDLQTAQRVSASRRPAEAVAIGTVYAELAQRADQEIVVYGTVVKATGAVGWIWVHIQDGTGSSAAETHDLTIQTKQPVVRGQRVAFRGMLRSDVDIGFGYEYTALVEDAVLIEP